MICAEQSGEEAGPLVRLQLARGQERRRAPRHRAAVVCKLRRSGSIRFAAARTENVSRTGALLDVAEGCVLGVGDLVELAIAWQGSRLLRASEMVRAHVVRSVERAGGVRVALAFTAELAEVDGARAAA